MSYKEKWRKHFWSEPVRVRNKQVWRWFSAPLIIHSHTVSFLFQVITYANESLVPKCSYALGSGFPGHFANFTSSGFSSYGESLITVSWWSPGQGPVVLVSRSRQRSSHEIHSFSWSTTIDVVLSDTSQGQGHLCCDTLWRCNVLRIPLRCMCV